jgi:hypothetical protein
MEDVEKQLREQEGEAEAMLLRVTAYQQLQF